jgi:hypothetical protein
MLQREFLRNSGSKPRIFQEFPVSAESLWWFRQRCALDLQAAAA